MTYIANHASINFTQRQFRYSFSYTAHRRQIVRVILLQRHCADIINLHYRRVLSNQELKPKIVSSSRGKLDHIIHEHSCRIIACVDRVDRLLVNLDTYKTFASSTFVEICAEPQGVR